MTDTPPPRRLPPDFVTDAMDDTLRKAEARPKTLSRGEIDAELEKCRTDVIYFINTYCWIYDNVVADWIPFKLWPDQEQLVRETLENKYSAVLKARQMGISWALVVAVRLWKMRFRPIAKVLMFSQRDDEAADMLERLRGMYQRLPDWMKLPVVKSNDHEFTLSNESSALALTATAGGRSHAATDVVIDECDFIQDTASLVKAARPTIDAGAGQMVLLSTANEKTPNSYFQTLFKGAYKGESEWKAFFLSWRSNPLRTQAWYDQKCKDALLLEGSLDSVWKEYPETVEQALAARSSNKRFPPMWISYFSYESPGLAFAKDAPFMPGLIIYREAEAGHSYGIGADPAEGMQSSDDSVLIVIDEDSREEVATLAGKIEPETLADYAALLSEYYNNAPVLPERNNHGHVFISHMKKDHVTTPLRNYIVDGKPGWHTSQPSKVRLYTHAVEILQRLIALTHPVDDGGERPILNPDKLPKIIHNPETTAQLANIDSGDATHAPAAPENLHDDYATAWVLAQMCVMVGTSSMEIVPHTLWNKSSRTGLPRTQSRPVLPVVNNSANLSDLEVARRRIEEKYGRFRR